MCGINGLININSRHITEPNLCQLKSSLSLMKARGPNAQASCQGPNWLLGHTRLSIIDLNGGAQPMQDAATGVTLSYNGEIYNYLRLKNELTQLGHFFNTNSDTEVLLRSYLQWGRDCLNKINGCFAFAIIDPQQQTFLIARDRLGVKPLYYYKDESKLCFASSVSAVKALSGTQEIDPAAVSHYFTTCRITFGEKTLYKNIKTLMPGCWLSFSMTTKSCEKGRYWQRPALSPEEKVTLSAEEIFQQTRQLVDTSISERLMSDVPLGCFLSGGLDSAIVGDSACRASSDKLPFYCAGTPFEKYNEFQYAEEMSTKLNSPLTQVTISPDTFMEDWRHLIHLKGLPLSTPNETSIFRLAKALSQDCKVALTGEGSDEIFGGYIMPHFGVNDYLRAPHTPEEAEGHVLQWKLMQRYGRSFFYNEVDHFFLSSSWMPVGAKASLFESDIWAQLDEDDEVFTYYEDFFERYAHLSPFDRRMQLHAEVNLEGLLNRVDSSTMAASVEARVPFTDYRLVEFAFRQSDSWKMDWRTGHSAQEFEHLLIDEINALDVIESKKMLRRSYASRLPESIVKRPKMSFPVPFQEWLSGPLSRELEDFCLTSAKKHGVLREEQVKKMFLAGDRNLWLVANLCLWLES